ncbi:hypothetical protein K438DRAFT_1861035 [Mycena galopus ATCC 62051]|nr:hypothetical protein K438DRAFT_1861035 [Mycena galopus ATCC 62051]
MCGPTTPGLRSAIVLCMLVTETVVNCDKCSVHCNGYCSGMTAVVFSVPPHALFVISPCLEAQELSHASAHLETNLSRAAEVFSSFSSALPFHHSCTSTFGDGDFSQLCRVQFGLQWLLFWHDCLGSQRLPRCAVEWEFHFC